MTTICPMHQRATKALGVGSLGLTHLPKDGVEISLSVVFEILNNKE
jgi:hypothetical protein